VAIDLRDPSLPERAVREALCLSPHPEGGHYREVWRDRPASGRRGAGTSILFLLAAGERSRWHRVDAAEVWLWQAGAPLLLGVAEGGAGGGRQVRLGPDLAGGEVPQGVVPARAWQEARSLGAWTLVGCVVAPAFEFAGFEMAPAGWRPPAAQRGAATPRTTPPPRRPRAYWRGCAAAGKAKLS
jgi:hypothetical protein